MGGSLGVDGLGLGVVTNEQYLPGTTSSAASDHNMDYVTISVMLVQRLKVIPRSVAAVS